VITAELGPGQFEINFAHCDDGLHAADQAALFCLSPPLRLHLLPMPLFRALLAAARAGGIARDLTGDAIARMRDDLVFDAGPAARDLGYAPRAFAPAAAMFDAPQPSSGAP